MQGNRNVPFSSVVPFSSICPLFLDPHERRRRVQVTIEVHANLPDGASDKLVRDVTENCRTLRFTDFGFEEA
jgi:hypothetical protein